MRTKNVATTVGLAALLAVAGTGAVAAVAKDRPAKEKRGPVSAQAFQQRTQDVSTSSKAWQFMPMTGSGNGQGIEVRPLVIRAKGVMAVTVSADVEGGPAELRVRNRGNVLRPSLAKVRGSNGDTSRSFTFVTKGSSEFKCHSIEVQWRAAAGVKVTSARSSIHVTYEGQGGNLGSRCEPQL